MNEELLKLKHRALTDHYFFSKKICGFNKIRPNPHQEMSDFLAKSSKKKKLILSPRGSFKSSHITIAYSIQRIVQNPNIRILISSETQVNACRYVREIRGHFESNPRLRALFGDQVNKGSWKAEEFTVRSRTQHRKEGTVQAGSLDKSVKVGTHVDLCILDDVVSMSNIANEVQINRTIDHYKLLLSILDPGGEILIIGTRWAHFELYSWLLDPEEPENSQIDSFVREAEDDDGNLTMPEVLSREFLDQQRKTQGEYIYQLQYLNRVNTGSFSTFKESDLQFYVTPPEGLVHFLTIDPAVGMNRRSDFSGIIMNGVDYYNNYYIREALELRIEPSDLINLIFELYDQYQPFMSLGMEKFALEKMLKHSLLQEMNKRGKYFPIKELVTNNRVSKNVRIRALQPLFEQKKIFLLRDHKALIHQIRCHPSLKHDDVLDALKSQIQITFPSDIKPSTEPDKKPLGKLEEKAKKELEKFTSRKVRNVINY